MPIQSSGPISLLNIQGEFGGSPPISLSEYYRGGLLVPSGPGQNANIATSGAISFGSFYGSVRQFVFDRVFVATTWVPHNLRTMAVAAGWDQTTPLNATITINTSAFIQANSTSGYAFDTGTTSYPSGSTLTIVNKGFILGSGGNGGSASQYVYSTGQLIAGSAGGAGGPALRVNLPTVIDNLSGIIGGGGGGGGGGATKYVMISDKYGSQYVGQIVDGGGGGGGRTNTSSPTSGGAAGNDYNFLYGIYNATGGAGGTYSGAGGGGRGDGVNSSNDGGVGGSGGNWGANGGSGTSGVGFAGYSLAGGPYAGGASGAAVVGNSFVTWISTGQRFGALVA